MIIKFIRFIKIYGLRRSLFKSFGRLRSYYFLKPLYFFKEPSIGLVGCGQFQFSTIAYFLSLSWNNRFKFAYDIDINKSKSLSKFYKIDVLENLNYDDLKVKTVYIASNHYSHSSYSINFLNRGVNVFCEKPVAVNKNQLKSLIVSVNNSSAKFYCGYNRPHSKFIKTIKKYINKESSLVHDKFSLNCNIFAHDLDVNHWYRNPQEGTRICGNVGHWIDLMIHFQYMQIKKPELYLININYSDEYVTDDNINISISNNFGDLSSIMISSRNEPFEGIYETISLQQGNLNAIINDFRYMDVWNGSKYKKYKSLYKDVGHKNSINQPFNNYYRDLNEVWLSTALTLEITEMVVNKITTKEISVNKLEKYYDIKF